MIRKVLLAAAVVVVAACGNGNATPKPAADSKTAESVRLDANGEVDCTDLLSKERSAFRARAKAECNRATTLEEAVRLPACLTEQHVGRCQTKQWGSRKGGLNLAPVEKSSKGSEARQ